MSDDARQNRLPAMPQEAVTAYPSDSDILAGIFKQRSAKSLTFVLTHAHPFIVDESIVPM
jgi:hypothetical protein